ncbi:hypothetical protein GCM10009682_35410 [Luedemannella flava]|uniref:Uncharacterized protein n=1 Tax=Luedemannella flava TaxID=349316 RepID=A0ABP4YJL5_9ACTN
MSTYLSSEAKAHLLHAQVLLDEHPVSSSDGLCQSCGTDGPCQLRRTALRVFGRYGRLPRRWPGKTRPELIRLRRVV